eukprot:1356581-Prymnesium_polylepis.1
MNGRLFVDGCGGGGGDWCWAVGRPLFVVANVMCGGWMWLSDGVEVCPIRHRFPGCFALICGCFAAVSRCFAADSRPVRC